MNQPCCTDTDYVDFLVATLRAVSGTEAARVQPRRRDAPVHDAFTRLLHRLEPDPATLWHEVAPLVRRDCGVLNIDDPTLDKPYAKKIELVHRHWSGKHHAVVDGINLIALAWSEGESLIPCDWRVFDKRNHIGGAIRAGCPLGRMRLEWHRVRTGIGWKLAKEGIIRHALRSYLAIPGPPSPLLRKS